MESGNSGLPEKKMKKIALSAFVLVIFCAACEVQKKPLEDNFKEVHDTSVPIDKLVDTFDYENWLLERRVPSELDDHPILHELDIKFHFGINPFYLRGDFNGDRANDIAVLVKNPDNKVGILIYHGGGEKISFQLLGAGNAFHSGGDNFNWLNIWFVYTQLKAEAGVGEAAPQALFGEMIWVEKAESASAIIYWDGSNYQWFQQGD